ncbi:GNAT family N-acetyltransferase [Fulvivirga aurantia]|uniref:GNAT family N-acetyltransferase n=1 Tax=Fulvivirga aurantia TaxID=2529383 RepID=UPI0016271F80|nr:GNAT family N-acetyltransferase [Fulvivirga aurantia]
MDHEFTFRQLKALDLTDMYLAFLSAFSDYPIDFKLSKEQFVRKFVEKLKIDFGLSVAAFDEENLCSFIFTSVNYYEGKLTAYNGGTGVRPPYRGKKLTEGMYEYLTPLLHDRGIKQCVLEVLTENQRAIKAYTNVGFTKSKTYKCFRLASPYKLKRRVDFPIKIYAVKEPTWHLYERFATDDPSFLDCSQMISQNLANESIIEAHLDGACVGYAIFQSAAGRVSQIAVDNKFRQHGIGAALLNYMYELSIQKNLTVININIEAKETLTFFERLGFENQINQYEMVLTL